MQTEVGVPSRGSAHPEGDRRRRQRRWSVPTWTIAAAFLTAVAIVLPLGPGAKGLAILGVVLVPGATATAMTRLTLSGPAQRVFLTLVVGIALLLAVGLLCALVLKPLGVDHPLTRGPMLVVWMVVLVASVVLPARLEKDPVRWLFSDVTRRHGLWLIGLGVLPALALLGAGRLNAGHGAALAVGVCAVSVGVLVVVLVSALWVGMSCPRAPPYSWLSLPSHGRSRAGGSGSSEAISSTSSSLPMVRRERDSSRWPPIAIPTRPCCP